jgi:hypothetical protein
MREEEFIKVVGGKARRRRPLRRQRHRWVIYIEAELGGVGLGGGGDWFGMTVVKDEWRAVVNAVMSLWAP